MRTLVLGDIHGAYRALQQVFERSKFDLENDRLIFVGDVVDGWPESKECIELLLKVKNLVYILGNHDEWVLDWASNGFGRPDHLWVNQGGRATLKSYTDGDGAARIPRSHVAFLRSGRDYFEETVLMPISKDANPDDGVPTYTRCFVHGGMKGDSLLGSSGNNLRWDRDFWFRAVKQAKLDPTVKLGGHDQVWLGHTTVGDGPPVIACNVINLDTGAGWEGRLTIMDADTGEWWQSDKVTDLYPGVRGRFNS